MRVHERQDGLHVRGLRVNKVIGGVGEFHIGACAVFILVGRGREHTLRDVDILFFVDIGLVGIGEVKAELSVVSERVFFASSSAIFFSTTPAARLPLDQRGILIENAIV